MRFDGPAPDGWRIELVDGQVLEVWAGGYERDGEHYTFSNLVELDDGEALHEGVLVTSEAPMNPRSKVIAVARIPKAAVRSILSM